MRDADGWQTSAKVRGAIWSRWGLGSRSLSIKRWRQGTETDDQRHKPEEMDWTAYIAVDTIQIVYDTNHWVATAFVEDEVYVKNSLGNNISPLVSKQLKELYRHRVSATGSLAVNVVQCSQQPNYKDCAIFASAFAFEWATATVKCIALYVKFVVGKMRTHLAECLERQMPFPRISSTRSSTKTGYVATVVELH